MSMVHLADPLYYKELEEATAEHDRVLYELIVDQEVTTQDSTGWRRLKEPMVAPYPAQLPPSCQLLSSVVGPPQVPHSRALTPYAPLLPLPAAVNTASTQKRPSFDQLQLAAHHGLQAQLEALDYMKDSWCLADMDRDSIRRLQAQVLTLKKSNVIFFAADSRASLTYCTYPIRNTIFRTQVSEP